MAYEGYRAQSTDDQSQYNNSNSNSSYYEHRDSVHYNGTEPGSARPLSRASSRGGKSDISNQPQPFYDAANAVNYAFERSDAASHVDPKLIAQITEQVKKQVIDSLKSSGITAQHTGTSSNHSPTDSYPSRNVYTPPSPTRHTFSCDGSNASESPRQRSGFDAQDDNPTPRFERVERTMSTTSSHASEQSRRERPVTAQRVPTDGEATTVEKIWKPLFDDSNKPTPRLGQFLRGLANHLINDYEPKKSLVVTPEKMLRFYDETTVGDEVFPWNKIFNGTSNATLSKIYRELRCQHHLVQEAGQNNSAPQTPALTPSGFEKWMETIILAYPDVEFERLSHAVREMPISNADDTKERFPKELLRRQFPQNGSLHAQQMTGASLSCGGKVPAFKTTSFPPPPPLQTQTQPNLERQRSPYSAAPNTSTSASEDEASTSTSTAIPIERERKPYTAKEGTGKFHEDSTSTRGSRSQSSASQTSGTSTARSSGADYTQTATRHSRTNSNTTGRRGRSPSFSSGAYGTRSDGNINDIPSSQYASNLYDYDEKYRDPESRRGDYSRRQTEADLGTSYPPGPRSVYDDEYHRSRSMSSGYAAYGGAYGSTYAQTPTRY